MKYLYKNNVVEAIQFNGDNIKEISEIANASSYSIETIKNNLFVDLIGIVCYKDHGVVAMEINDYVVKDYDQLYVMPYQHFNQVMKELIE